MPYWFEAFAPCFPWIVPAIALSGLWVAKSIEDKRVQRLGERVFFAALMLVAGATLRTMIANDSCWLLHTASMGVMILGAIFPHAETSNIEHDGDVILTEL